jgi:hypothetical protein
VIDRKKPRFPVQKCKSSKKQMDLATMLLELVGFYEPHVFKQTSFLCISKVFAQNHRIEVKNKKAVARRGCFEGEEGLKELLVVDQLHKQITLTHPANIRLIKIPQARKRLSSDDVYLGFYRSLIEHVLLPFSRDHRTYADTYQRKALISAFLYRVDPKTINRVQQDFRTTWNSFLFLFYSPRPLLKNILEFFLVSIQPENQLGERCTRLLGEDLPFSKDAFLRYFRLA